MYPDEQIVNGVLCYEFKGKVIEFTKKQLTDSINSLEAKNNRLLSRVKELENELNEVTGGY